MVIADQGSNNRRVFETSCGVEKDRPYLIHEDDKIYVLYDPSHLLKNIRNNLKKSGFSSNGVESSWSHIESLFLFDRKNRYRMASKLTYRQIYLPPFASLRVRFAAQVLSHTVAAGFSTLVESTVLPPEAKETATFAENFDQLFNAFNSATWKANQRMRHAFTATSGHKEFLLYILSWLTTLQSHSNRKLPCINGWIMDIQSLLSLWAVSYTHLTLPTRRTV